MLSLVIFIAFDNLLPASAIYLLFHQEILIQTIRTAMIIPTIPPILTRISYTVTLTPPIVKTSFADHPVIGTI